MNKQDLGLSKNLGTLKKESNNNEKSNSIKIKTGTRKKTKN